MQKKKCRELERTGCKATKKIPPWSPIRTGVLLLINPKHSTHNHQRLHRRDKGEGNRAKRTNRTIARRARSLPTSNAMRYGVPTALQCVRGVPTRGRRRVGGSAVRDDERRRRRGKMVEQCRRRRRPERRRGRKCLH